MGTDTSFPKDKNPNFKSLASLQILALKNPEFKILADLNFLPYIVHPMFVNSSYRITGLHYTNVCPTLSGAHVW